MPSATTIHPDQRATNGAVAAGATRSLARRRPLPNGRAAIGGLLVALSTVALFTLGQRDTDDLQQYATASRNLPIGGRIGPSDLTTTRLLLSDDALGKRLFRQRQSLIGAVVIAPIADGELIQASAVVEANAQAERRQISVPIEAARALGDRLRIGEFVDVVATFGAGTDAYSATVVTRARVVGLDSAVGPLSDRSREVVVLAVDTAAEGVAIAHAIAAGEVSLVRVSGVAADEAGRPYRAPTPDP